MLVLMPTTSYSPRARRIRASLRTIGAPGDEFRDERVVEDRHLTARFRAAVVANARSARTHRSAAMRPGDGMKPLSASSA
jgi:hypothetical protein